MVRWCFLVCVAGHCGEGTEGESGEEKGIWSVDDSDIQIIKRNFA